jgi:hypothetical protein
LGMIDSMVRSNWELRIQRVAIRKVGILNHL